MQPLQIFAVALAGLGGLGTFLAGVITMAGFLFTWPEPPAPWGGEVFLRMAFTTAAVFAAVGLSLWALAWVLWQRLTTAHARPGG